MERMKLPYHLADAFLYLTHHDNHHTPQTRHGEASRRSEEEEEETEGWGEGVAGAHLPLEVVLVVDVVHAEALAVAVRPLEVVQQTPREVTLHRH